MIKQIGIKYAIPKNKKSIDFSKWSKDFKTTSGLKPDIIYKYKEQ